MALILNIETATEVCSVALAQNGKLLSLAEEIRPNSHSSVLTILIRKVFESANLNITKVNAVAISAGPGSFTGLRIGTSAAKGLCYALNKPLIAVPTLAAMAFGAIHAEKDMEAYYCPIIESIKDEVFAGLYTSSLEEVVAAAPQDIELKKMLPFFENKKVIISGTGLDRLSVKTSIKKIPLSNSAKNMIGLSETLFSLNAFNSIKEFQPAYMKNFIPRLPVN